jgi:rhodanese-related sulfurtransferase
MTVTALRHLPAPRSVEDLLRQARAGLDRYSPARASVALGRGALLVDIRPHAQRVAEGEVAGALVLERNVLEWRLDPQSAARVPEAAYDLEVVVLCSEGYTSSLAAAALHGLGLWRATDLEGGFGAWRAAGLPTIRGGTPAGERCRDRFLDIDVERWEVRVAGSLVRLTRQEFRVLAALHEARGRVVSRVAMAELVDVYPSATRALDVHVCRLRAKLGSAGSALVTVRGVGWRLLRP